MKPFILLTIVSLGLSVSCREETDPRKPCSVDSPVEELPWLKDQIDEWEATTWRQYAYVLQARYGYETVFIFGNCCPYCSTVVPIYNCLGEQIGTWGTIPDEMLEDQKLIWKSEDSSCTL